MPDNNSIETQTPPVGIEGYDTWYNTEAQAATAIKSMRDNGINADRVAPAYHSESSDFKFKIYRSMEEVAELNNAYNAKRLDQQAADKTTADTALAERNNIDGFGSDQTPMQLGKTVLSLNKAIQFEGNPTTIKALVKKLVLSGEITTTEQHDVIKPMTRTQYNRATGREQDAHEKKIKDAGQKTVYYVGDYNLGKTAHDYAQHLINYKMGDIEMPKTKAPEVIEAETLDMSSSNYHAVYELNTGKIVGVFNGSRPAQEMVLTDREKLQATYCGEAINLAFSEGKTIIRNESGAMEVQTQTLDPAAQKYLDDRQKHNDQADEHNRLRRVGQEALPGIRFADAAEVGRVWEMVGKGDLNETEWDAYKNQLINENRVTVKTREDYEKTPVFDDAYSGPRFKYGMINRPYGFATAPKGAILMTYKPEDKENGSRHGTIEYPFQLTKDDVASFELVDFPAIKQQEFDFRIIRNDFVKELEKRGFVLTVSNSEGMLADLATPNGFIQAGINYKQENDNSYHYEYHLTLNTDKLNHAIELEYQTPAKIDITRSLNWIDKEIAKTVVIDPLASLNAIDPDFAAFVMKQDQGHNEGYSPKESVLHIDSTAKAQGLEVRWTHEGNSEYGPSVIAGFTINGTNDIAGAQIFKDGKAMFFINGERFKEGELYASSDPETQSWAITGLANAMHIKAELSAHEKHMQAIYHSTVLHYETEMQRRGFTTMFGENEQSMIATMDFADDKMLATRIYQDKQGCHIELSKDDTVMLSHMIFDTPDKINMNRSLEIVDSELANHITPELTDTDKIKTLALTIARYSNEPLSYNELAEKTGLTHADLDKHWTVANKVAENAIYDSGHNNLNEEIRESDTQHRILVHAIDRFTREHLEDTISDPEASLRELWTRKGVSPEKQEALLADITAKSQPGAYVGPFQIPASLTLTPSSTTQSQEDSPMEPNTVQASTEFKITGAKLTEKLDYLEKTQVKKVGYLDKQLERIVTMPPTTERPNKVTGEVFTTSAAQELAKMARTEAINAMSKGEYVHNMNVMRDMNKKRSDSPLSNEDDAKYSKAKDRNARLSKEANHPEKKVEFDKQFKKAFYFQCTEDGIKDQMKTNNTKLENTTSLLAKVKELPEHEFTIKIKEQRNLPDLRYDVNFGKQLDAALAAKNAPAPAPATEPVVKPAGRKR